MTKVKNDIPVGNLIKVNISNLMFEYFVSDAGFVYRYKNSIFKKCKVFKYLGYLSVKLRIWSNANTFKYTERNLSILILSSFTGIGSGVLFLDGNENNCRLDNLKYKTKNDVIYYDNNLIEIIEPNIKRGYFISNMGCVYEFKNNSYYELSYSICHRSGHKLVRLKKNDTTTNENGLLCIVARFVMKYFVGNYVKNRRIRFMDGDRLNCSYENIKWKNGFSGNIDFEYCAMILNSNKLDIESELATEYILTKDKIILYSIFSKNKLFFKRIAIRLGVRSSVDDLMHDTFLNVMKAMDDGRWRPDESRSVMVFIYCIFRDNAILLKRYINKNSINRMISKNGYDHMVTGHAPIQLNTNSNSISIEDEIYEMFNEYAN